jgi:hypothetical protein
VESMNFSWKQGAHDTAITAFEYAPIMRHPFSIHLVQLSIVQHRQHLRSTKQYIAHYRRKRSVNSLPLLETSTRQHQKLLLKKTLQSQEPREC